MTTWRDANNASTTTWNRDAASGALLNTTYQGGNHTTYTWYATGKPHTRVWARSGSVTTTWSWNAYGDLTAINYTGNNPTTPNVSISALDCLGRPLTVAQDGIGTEHFTWRTVTGALFTHSYESGHLFLSGKGITWSAPDPHGLPTGYTGSDVGTVANTWLDGRLQNITSGTSTFDYDYFGDTNLVRHMTAWDSGSARFLQTRSYDISGRLLAASSASLATGTQPVTRHGYQLDSLGRRTTTTQLDGSTWTWGYNDRSEVTSSHRFERDATQYPAAHVEVPPFAETYAFDDIGNRKTSTSPILGNFTYTANALNQYAAIETGNDPANSNPTRAVVGTAPAGNVTINSAAATRINSIFFGDASAAYSTDPLWLDASVVSGSQTVARSVFVPAPSVTPLYDDDGNLYNDGRWTYAWDAENRLVQMETISTTENENHPHRKLTFAYDWTGHRLSRKVFGPSDASISDTRWLWDAWNPVAEYSGTTLSKSYIWGLDLSGTLQGAGGVGGLLAVTSHGSSSATFFPSFDGNGNITAWTKSGEAHATCLREYDAFGNVLVEQGTPPCGLGFSTKMEDPETGLVYYGLRYLQPPTGRWLSRDPVEEQGGVNLYGFVGNDGVGVIDCLGKELVAYKPGSATAKWASNTDFAQELGTNEVLGYGGAWVFKFKGVGEKEWTQRWGNIAKCDGCKLVLEGKIRGDILVKSDYVGRIKLNSNSLPTDSKRQKAQDDEHFQSTVTHERQHEAIEAAHWNKVVSQFNASNGFVFKKAGCCLTWAYYINTYALYEELLKNIDQEQWDVTDTNRNPKYLEAAQKKLKSGTSPETLPEPYSDVSCDEDRPQKK